MKRFLSLLAGTMLTASLLAQTACAEAPSGTWTTPGDKGAITLTLSRADEDGEVSGTLRGGTLNAKLTGESEDDIIEGVALSDDGTLLSGFRARREGNGIIFELLEFSDAAAPVVKGRIVFGGATAEKASEKLTPVKAAPVGKPAAPAPKAVAKPAAKPIVVAQGDAKGEPTGGPQGGDWKIYRHAVGISIRYPASWKTKEIEGALQIVPPGALVVGGQAREIYFAFADGAEGVTSAQDPRVLPYLDEKLRGIAPFLQQQGQVQTVNAGAVPGILATWQGTNPQGLDVRAHVFAVVLKGYGVGILAMGDAKRIAQREPVVRQMFASLAASSEQRDPQIAGTWKFWSYKSSPNGKFGTETKRRFILGRDGRCSWSSGGETSGSAESGSFVSNRNSNDAGRWSAANGTLYVLWNDGSTSSWSYRVGTPASGRRLYLTGASGKPDEWIGE
ncbi:MAG TPA: hypothetical protein VF681_07370 [Abditibacteriaceae bacterium]